MSAPVPTTQAGIDLLDGATIPLTAAHLCFTLVAEEELRFHPFKGSALRGALASTLRRHYCPAGPGAQADPLHRQLCPVCQLLAWEQDDTPGGDLRRPYVLRPPADAQTRYAAGEPFDFGLTILGDRPALLPYLVLGVATMAQGGLGLRNGEGVRGRARVATVESVHLLDGSRRTLYKTGDRQVQGIPDTMTHADVVHAAQALADALAARGNRLQIDFITPLRINQRGQLLKQPDFFPLVKQIARRMLDLCVQHAGARPPFQLRRDLYPAAETVQLVAHETEWDDLEGFSSRLGRTQHLGGLRGRAVYHAPDWRPLLPWLIWGQLVQVGKNTVKGCGCYTLSTA